MNIGEVMHIRINDNDYQVIINKKRIKNAYIRVNEALEIVISVNKLVPMFEINRFINNNIPAIEKMINKQLKSNEKDNHFYYLGEEYNIILNNSFFDIDYDNKKIYTNNLTTLEKYIKTEINVKKGSPK